MRGNTLGRIVFVWAMVIAPCIGNAASRLYFSDTLSNEVYAFDTSTNAVVGSPVAMTEHSRPLAPVVSADGTRVYVQSVDGAICVIDAASMQIVQTFDDPNPDAIDGPSTMTLSPDGRALYATTDGDIAFVDTASGAVTARMTGVVDALQPTIRASHDGDSLFVLDGAHGIIARVDVASRSVVGRVTVPIEGQYNELDGLAISTDDRTIYAATYLGDLVTIDTATMQIQSTTQVGTALYGVDLSPDGGHAFLAETGDACLVDVDLSRGMSSGTGVADNDCYAVASSRGGGRIFVASYVQNADSSRNYALLAFDNTSTALSEISGFSFMNFDSQSIGPGVAITPASGAWWNPTEPGRSFNIEVQDGTLVLIVNAYDGNGAPVWLTASGAYDAAAATFTGQLASYSGGQCLGCAYAVPTFAPVADGAVALAFSSPTTATLTVNSKTIPIEKYTW